MLSRIEKASKRSSVGKESNIDSDDDDDDHLIAAPLQSGQEKSTVIRNYSGSKSFDMTSLVSGAAGKGKGRSKEDNEGGFESMPHKVGRETRDDLNEIDPNAPKVSLPELITRVIPKRAQDLPWALPGTDQVSRFANDTLDAGDDLHITESFEPTEDNSSVIGNLSFVASESDDDTRKMQLQRGSSESAVKAKNVLRGKFSMRGQISRILPSKQYVSKLSKLTEDVPWTVAGQEQKLKRESNYADDNNHSNGTDPFQSEGDLSSTIGNSSLMGSQAQSLENSTKLKKFASHNVSTISEAKDSDGIEIRKDLPVLGMQGIAGKLNRALPGKVIRSSQKLMPWRLKSLVATSGRFSMDYQEMIEDDATVDSFDPLQDNYNIHRGGHGPANLVRTPSRQMTTQDDRRFKFSLPLDSDNAKGRALTWDSSSCSGMSDITEPTLYSKSSSFRRSRSMFIVPQESNLLRISDDLSIETTEEKDYITKDIPQQHSVAIMQEQARPILHTMNEATDFNSISEEEMFAPEIVNGFLSRIEAIERANGTWDTITTLGNDHWRPSSVDSCFTSNRLRVFSDSDAVYEFQRQRLQENDQADVRTPDDFGGNVGDEQFEDNGSLALFVDSDEFSQEMPVDCVSEIDTELETSSVNSDSVPFDEFRPSLTRTRFFSDSECLIKAESSLATKSHQKAENAVGDLQRSLDRRPRLPSDSCVMSKPATMSSGNEPSDWWSGHPISRPTSQLSLPNDGSVRAKPRSMVSTAATLQDVANQPANDYYWNELATGRGPENPPSASEDLGSIWIHSDHDTYDDIL
eukprot:scaffold5395_cov126-Cylindrotheca_fusiformis.AAC.14